MVDRTKHGKGLDSKLVTMLLRVQGFGSTVQDSRGPGFTGGDRGQNGNPHRIITIGSTEASSDEYSGRKN